jgi:hypothetical protein
MATNAEILNTLVKQMNARGFSVKLMSPMEIELQKLDKFSEGILKRRFGKTGEPE